MQKIKNLFKPIRDVESLFLRRLSLVFWALVLPIGALVAFVVAFVLSVYESGRAVSVACYEWYRVDVPALWSKELNK